MERYYRRSHQVASRVIDGEAVLVKMPESLLFALNAAASRIWVEADGTRTGSELGEGRDADAVESFLDDMAKRGLFERASSPTEEADVFPQDVAWPEAPEPSEPPKIVATEPMGVMAGCAFTVELLCNPDYFLNS